MVLTIIPMFSSCTKWLDVSSSTDVLEKDLFESGEGYRQALNGIYSLMCEPSLYGRELTWGFSTVMSGLYTSSDITSNYYIMDYYSDYLGGEPDTDDMESYVYKPIWAAAYNVIANCNNLLSYAEAASASLFEYNEYERDLIIGECKAVRALMHFEMVRLFGGALHEDSANERYVPYVTDLYITVPDYYTTAENMAFIIQDLIEACEALEATDAMFDYEFANYRLTGGISSNAEYFYTGNNSFFAGRGYRLNYYATKVLLARAYMYCSEYDLAYETAKEVYDRGPYGEGEQIFSFDSFSYDSFVEEVLFGGYDPYIEDEYTSFLSAGMSLTIENKDDYFGEETYDYRCSKLFEEDSDSTIRWSEGTYYSSVIPVIRFSEVYHIMAECMVRSECSKYDRDAAIALLQQLRFYGRNVSASLATALEGKSDSEVLDAIWNDVIRETMDEGHVSWLYKRVGYLDGPLPVPSQETDYMTY